MADVTPGWASTHLERQGSVGEVAFNPFNLKLRASGLRLTEPNGAPLVATTPDSPAAKVFLEMARKLR